MPTNQNEELPPKIDRAELAACGEELIEEIEETIFDIRKEGDAVQNFTEHPEVFIKRCRAQAGELLTAYVEFLELGRQCVLRDELLQGAAGPLSTRIAELIKASIDFHATLDAQLKKSAEGIDKLLA